MAFLQETKRESKVFIAYPHNPGLYEQLEPPDLNVALTNNPGMTREQLEVRFAQEEHDFLTRQQDIVKDHMKLVHEFATFLQSNGVSVEYDQRITDTGCDNHKMWCEEKIEQAKYVILIVTPSLQDFLKGEVPPDDELLFVGDYMHNLIAFNAKKFLSVFLDRRKAVDLLPISLAAGNKYEVIRPFLLDGNPRRDDLEALYALLTDYDRFQAPPPPKSGPIALKQRGRGIGQGVVRQQQQAAAHQASPHHRDILDRLSRLQVPLADLLITAVSEIPDFNSRWKLLASELDLSPAQIEACEVNSGGFGNSEKCLLMLKCWRNNGPPGANGIAHLANVLYHKLRNMTMLQILYDKCMLIK